MTDHYNEDSFGKGKAFEDFVEHFLFPSSHFELLHKTNPHAQNADRYVQTSLKPDFQFKSKVTGIKFYVEAKFRTRTYKDVYDVLSRQQFENFPDIQLEEKCTVLIAFGYGGKASNPDFISLIPLKHIPRIELSPTELSPFHIAKSTYPCHDLQKLIALGKKENATENDEVFSVKKPPKEIKNIKKASKQSINV